MGRKAIIAGATGLIGGEILNILLTSDAYDEVLILVRKKLNLTHSKLVQLVIDFDQMEDHRQALNGDVVFSCLGTTKKKTPDPKTYYTIDHDYPLRLAKIALENGVKQYHLVSSVGANPNSKTFYIRLKGETERDIRALNFPSVFLYEPSMLTGRKQEKRLAENIFEGLFKFINPLFTGNWKKYRSVAGVTVATAMIDQSLKNEPGIWVIHFEGGLPVKHPARTGI